LVLKDDNLIYTTPGLRVVYRNYHESFATYEEVEAEYLEYCKRVGRQWLIFESKKPKDDGESSQVNEDNDHSVIQLRKYLFHAFLNYSKFNIVFVSYKSWIYNVES
jgi:hypothetical protein